MLRTGKRSLAQNLQHLPGGQFCTSSARGSSYPSLTPGVPACLTTTAPARTTCASKTEEPPLCTFKARLSSFSTLRLIHSSRLSSSSLLFASPLEPHQTQTRSHPEYHHIPLANARPYSTTTPTTIGQENTSESTMASSSEAPYRSQDP